MRPRRIHFGGERNVKNNEILRSSKNTAAASSSKQSSSSICLEEPAKKRGKKNVQRGPGAGMSIQVPGTYHMKDNFDNQPRTNLRRGLLQKAVTTRDRCVAHMLLRSCRDVRRPRHFFAQRKTYRYCPISSRWNHENQISYYPISETPRPGRYTKIKSKTDKTIMHFLIFRTYQVHHT